MGPPQPVERTTPEPRKAPCRRPSTTPHASTGAGFDTALATHLQASQTLSDTALEHLSARIHAAAGTVEFTIELSPAGTSRLTCEALEANAVRLLQTTVPGQIASAVLATTTHAAGTAGVPYQRLRRPELGTRTDPDLVHRCQHWLDETDHQRLKTA